MEEKHGGVVKTLENRLKMIWCSSCDKEKRADRLCQHLREVDRYSQPNSFTTNYATDWEKLSRACSSMSQVSETAKLLLQEKDKQITELKVQANKLYEKLESKDCELVKLRSLVGGLEVQELKVELAQAKVRLNERDKELVKTKLEADKQLNEVKVQLKEWQTKEREWLKMFGQVYNLSKDPSFYRDLKKALEGFQESLSNSKAPSAQGSPIQSQNSVDQNAEIIDTTRRYQEHGTYEQIQIDLLEGSQEPDIDIFKHRGFGLVDDYLFPHSTRNRAHTQNDTNKWESIEASETNPLPIYGQYYCPMCQVEFINFGARFYHYQFCIGLKKHYELIKQQLQAHKNNANEEEKKNIQSVLEFDGNTLKGVIDTVNLIKELTPLEKKAMKVWGSDYNEVHELYKQLHSKHYFKEAWLELVAGPVADTDGNPVYAQYTTRENLFRVLGKRKRYSATKIAREVITKTKQELGISLTLAEQKAEENDNICKLIAKNSSLFKWFPEWMKKYQVERVLTEPNSKKFEWVGPAFCDGIIVPKLPIFKSNNQYQAFLQKHGKLQIQKICDAADPGCLYVRLLDSANEFTEELIEGFHAINIQLLAAMDEHLSAQNLSSTAISEALKSCHIVQVDYTRDMKGAFYSYDMSQDINTLAKLLGLRKATHDEYTSIDSCFQFLKHAKGQLKELRMKFYNKIFHLIQSEQGKKKVSMNLKALINCSAAFFEKIDECINEGLSRCEFSQYFHSAEDLEEKLNFDVCISNLDKALEALNKVPSLYNTIPPIQFLDDYFKTFAVPLFIFEKHQWAVIYGRNKLSSYTGIVSNPCKMGKEEFIVRFTYNNIINIIDNTDESDLPKDTLVTAIRTGPQVMQIPMQSLGVTRKIKNMFNLEGTKLTLAMSEQQLSQVSVINEEGNLFFKVAEKKQKAHKTLKRKAVPFSEAKPKQRQHLYRSNEDVFIQQLDNDNVHVDCIQFVGEQVNTLQEESANQKKREEKKINKEKHQRNGDKYIATSFVSNGSKNGTKRVKCKQCKITINIDKVKGHQCLF